MKIRDSLLRVTNHYIKVAGKLILSWGSKINPANICLDEDVLKTSFVFVFRRRLDQDEYIRPAHTSSEHVFKTSWSRPIYSSWPYVFKTSSRHFQDVLPRRLQDVFKTSSRHVFKTSSRRVFKTSSRHGFKTSSRRLQRNSFSFFKTSSRRLQDVFARRLQDVLEDEKLLC